MDQDNQLLIPDAAKRDLKSFELLRVWVANKAQHVTLRVDVWKDPAAWGIMLADLARHIANSYAQEEALGQMKILQKIKSTFDAEMSNPTDNPTGRRA